MQERLAAVARELEAFQNQIGEMPVTRNTPLDEILAHLRGTYDFEEPTPFDTLLADTSRMLRDWDLHTPHPRYFGLFNPGVTPASIAADALVAGYNPQLATCSHAPASTSIEAHTIRFFLDRLSWGVKASGFFCSGGQEANLSGVLCGLTRAFPEYGEDGLRSLSGSPTIYLSREAHDSFQKIAHATGIGRSSVRVVGTDTSHRLDPEALRRRVTADRAEGHLPFLVVATAGTTAAGIIDPLAELADFCEAENLWLHVDAAWGGGPLLSDTKRHVLDGIERVHSITFDAHKWLQVPMGAGMFFCRHKEVPLNAFGVQADYMPPKTNVLPDPYLSTPQWSRRLTGLKVFMSLAEWGRVGYQDRIDQMFALGDRLRSGLVGAGWQVLNDTPLPIACFTRPGLDVDSVLESVYGKGDVWISKVMLGGHIPALRACITNYQTTEVDVDWLIAAVSEWA